MGEPDLSADERAELEHLRVEVTELRTQRVQRSQQARRHHLGWRGPVAILLITLGCILAPVSVVAVWTADQVSDTGRYVANVTPLVHDPAVQNALTDKITSQITGQLDVAGLANQAAALLTSKGLTRVGTLLNNFSASIVSSVNGFIHSAVRTIVSGPRFAAIWVRANTVVHQELVKALSGRGGGAVTVSNGQVVVGLGPFIADVKQNLSAQGLTLVSKLPTPNPTFPLFSAKYLVKAQKLYRLINDLKIVLPILTLLLIAAGGPSLTFLAAVQVIATAGAGLGLTSVAVAVVVVITVLLVWLPLVLYLAAPGATTRRLKAFNGWLRARASTLIVGVLVVVGAIMIGTGAYGLAIGK